MGKAMAKSIDSQFNFSAGEMSPKIDARIDNPKYRAGLRSCCNMVPLTQGPITRRPGTQFISQSKFQNTTGHNYACRLMKFVFNPNTSFVLEFGNQYIRFYSNGVQVSLSTATLWVSGTSYIVGNYSKSTINGLVYYCILATSGATDPSADSTHWVQQNIYEVPSPYNADAGFSGDIYRTDVFVVTPCQINDVVYLVHPNFPPYKLIRFSDTNWTLQPVVYSLPPVLDQNITNTTLTVAANQSGANPPGTLPPAYAGSTLYPIGTYVSNSGNVYVCTVYPSFTSTSFGADLGTGKLLLVYSPSGGGGTINANSSFSISASAPAWVAGTYYTKGMSVSNGATLYTCNLTNYASAAFATDLASGIWSVQTIFQAGHVGSIWTIKYPRTGTYVALPITANGTSATLPVKGAWELVTSEAWSADIALQRSFDNGVTWSTIRTLSARGDLNRDISGTELVDCLMQIVITNWTTITSSVPPRVVLTNVDAMITNSFTVTAVIDPYHALVNATTGKFVAGASSIYWAEAAWSAVRGYPFAICSFQQRIIYANTAFQPQRIWGTVTNDIENFDLGDQSQATDSFAFDLAAPGRGPIYWLISQIDLFAGLSGAEWVINSGATSQGASLGGAITPTSINAVEHSNWGSNDVVSPYIVGDAVVYCQRQATGIRQMLFSIYTQKYMSQDVTEMSDHLFSSGVVQMDYQPQWHGQGILWVVNRQGNLLGLSYDLERDIFGWSRHNTGYGQTDPSGNSLVNDTGFESVAVIDGAGTVDDEIWVVANRTIGASNRGYRYIERMNPANWETTFVNAPGVPYPDYTSAFYVDSGVQVTGTGITGVTLSHLPNRWIIGLLNGIPFGPILSDNSGDITITNNPPSGTDVVIAGLPIRYACNPMKIDIDPKMGNTQGLIKQVSDVFVRVMNSSGGEISNGEAVTPNNFNVPIPYPVAAVGGSKFVTGPIDIRVPPQKMPWPNNDPVFMVTGNDASPLTICAIIPKYEVASTP